MDKVYEGLRRWAVQKGHASNRPSLCIELARLASLYGILTGTAGGHSNKSVEQELGHLRAMGVDVHRPLTLRFLKDASDANGTGSVNDELEGVLGYIGTWITRLWLADRPTAGMNKAVSELAYGPGPNVDEDYAGYWLRRIQRLRNTRIGVPNDEEVREGIYNRKAYGASATRASFAVLCAFMEAEQGTESPPRDPLTVEHVMPQKLTDDWRRDLGADAEVIHRRYRDRLANLTLSGFNPSLGTKTFEKKREIYGGKSSVNMTSRLSQEDKWDEDALERRAEVLSRQALERWPWQDPRADESHAKRRSTGLRWRIEDGPWHNENVASQMVLNVAGALLTREPANAERLSGEAVTRNIHPANRYPPGATVGTLLMHAIPEHKEYVIYPYGSLKGTSKN